MRPYRSPNTIRLEILSLLGVGGMGEVYRARDTKLGREVAIKVLPAAFAADADRMARFQRGAHVLASLNHPSEDRWPAWTPDGRRIAFASARAGKGTWNLYWQRVDGTGEAELLIETKNRPFPGSWHPSGRFLALVERNIQANTLDLVVLPMEGNEASEWKPGEPTAFLSTLVAALAPPTKRRSGCVW